MAARSSVGDSVEAKELVRAMRAIEAKVESGLAYREYSQEVGTLAVAIAAFDELQEGKNTSELQVQLKAVLTRHQQARELWGACVSSTDCSYSFINMKADNNLPLLLAKEILVDLPAQNSPREQGGSLIKMDSDTEYFRVHYPSLLSGLWSDAKAKSKAFRAALR
ncbi:MAG: hypothetical protein RR609_07470 [Aurantimicrobium sp.]